MQLDKNLLRQILKDNNITNLNQINDLIKEMVKDVLQEALEAEMDDHLGYERNTPKDPAQTNARNGFNKKTVNSNFGSFDVKTPRDRDGEFEPQILPKYSKDISNIEEKIISMYGLGMTSGDIYKHMEDIYGVEVSPAMISKITDKVLPLVKEWQTRPLEEVYPFVFLDAIIFNVREGGRIIKKAANVVVGVNLEGKKDVLGIYISTTESSKFWMECLTDLKVRGIKDILIVSVDGLTGFESAISSVFPQAEIQRCIVHQIRNTLSFVSYKDRKEFAGDLKKVYSSGREEDALTALTAVQNKWNHKYMYPLKSWENNWAVLSTFFKYPVEIRKMMYTTNAIESLNSQYRKVTKGKNIFPTDDSIMKILYLATGNITKKWTTSIRDWDLIKNQLFLIFEDRLKDYAR